MGKFRVFVYVLMRDGSLKQRIPCIIRISIVKELFQWEKSAHYTQVNTVAEYEVILRTLHFAVGIIITVSLFLFCS